MKKITLSVLLLAMGAGVYAQGPRPKMDHTHLPPPLEAKLKLTPEQETKVTALLKAKNVEIDSLVKHANIRNGKMVRAKIRSTDTEVNDQLYALFNSDQKLVYAQWIIDRQAKMGKGGPPPARPIAKN